MSEPTPVYLSIKERIERRLVAILGEVVGEERTVYRWDMRGPRDAEGNPVSLVDGDGAVIAEDETAQEGSEGSPGTTIKTLPVMLQILTRQADSELENSSVVHNRRLAAMEAAVTADPTLIEADTGAALATDLRVTGTARVETETNQREQVEILLLEVQYEHDRDNPYQGPGLTPKENDDA